MGDVLESYLLLTLYPKHHHSFWLSYLSASSYFSSYCHHLHVQLGLQQAGIIETQVSLLRPSCSPLPYPLFTSSHIWTQPWFPTTLKGRRTILARGPSRGHCLLAFPASSVAFPSALLSSTVGRPGLCPLLRSRLSPFLWCVSSDPPRCPSTIET